MHKGIVHDSGSNQGFADEQRIAHMYVFPHAWEIILNRLWGMKPVHSITFENPLVDPPRSNSSATRVTTERAGIPDLEVVTTTTTVRKFKYRKGEVYKVAHELDELIDRGQDHFTSGEIAPFLDGRLVEVLDYKDQTRSMLPKLGFIVFLILLIYLVAWIVLKTFKDFPF